jgi:hypothetical protein
VLPEQYAVVDRTGRILVGDLDVVPVPPAPNPYEHSSQAISRTRHQENAWNVVWWRRVVYFLTMAATLLVVLVPLWPGRDRIGLFDYALPIMSAGVSLLGGVLPAFLSGWLSHYETYPLQLFMGLLAIAVLMVIGAKLKQAIADRMREVWAASGIAAERVPIRPQPNDWLYRLRKASRYFAFFRFFSRTFWPHLFGIAMLVIFIGGIPVGLLRLTFDVSSVLGFVCWGSVRPAEPQVGPLTFAFEPRTFCHATGIPIVRGARYRVEMVLPTPDMPDGAWRDGTITVESPAGFTSREHPLIFYPLAPLRRVLQADWFVPIARVGSTGAEHYALNEAVTEFTAQRNGELIVFVNEAIAPWPNWDRFYRNNSGGAACLRISRLEPNEASERVPLTPPVCS